MVTKEFSFTLPFLIALYEVTFREGGVRERIRLLVPFAFTLLIIPSLVFLQQADTSALDSTMRAITAADVSKISRTDYLLTQFRVVPLYVRLLFLPVGQNVDHDIPVSRSFLEAPVLVSFLFLFALFSAGIWFRSVSAGRKEYPELRLASFGILWFFIVLSVESSVIPLGELVAEYRMYLPSAGLIVAVVSLGAYTARRFLKNGGSGAVAWCGLWAAIALIFSVATFHRNRVWGSEIALWEDAARKSPMKVRPHQNLGTYYFMRGRSEDARRELSIALALSPNDPEIHNNLGLVYKNMGQYDNAIREFHTALALDPEDGMAHYNIGNLYLMQGEIPEAIREYQAAVARVPDYDGVHNNLGIAYDKNGQFREAFREFEEAVRLNPENENARTNLRKIVDKLRDSERSRRDSSHLPFYSRTTA
jgi:tetratricopeptide (TPR) repeat protein